MKLFSWVHKKLNGRPGDNCPTNNNASAKNQTPQLGGQKEEFSDWPQGFLSIGTLFTKSSKEDTKDEQNSLHQENSPLSSHNPILDITLEEVKELQKELNTLISSHDLDCLTSLGAENEKISHSSSSNYEGGDYGNEEEKDHIDDHHFTSNIVPNNKAKDVYLDRKKSLTFLLKKMFVCGVGGLGPTPSLRDPTLSATKTSIIKILRGMLRKKIYPQNSCPTMSTKKYLGNGQIASSNTYDNEDELDTEGNDQIKWDKSDTDYIVLEI